MNGMVVDLLEKADALPPRETVADALARLGLDDWWKLRKFNEAGWRVTFRCKGEGKLYTKIYKAKIENFDKTMLHVRTLIGESLNVHVDEIERTRSGKLVIEKEKEPATEKEIQAAQEVYDAADAQEAKELAAEEQEREDDEALKNGTATRKQKVRIVARKVKRKAKEMAQNLRDAA